MSVTSQIPRKVSTAAPGATLFPYDFKVLSKFDMQVQVDGVEKTVDVDYTLSGVGLDAGGDITFTTPLAGGETVMRRRLMSFERSNDFQQLGDLRSPTLNNDQDAPIMMIQQVADDVGRSIKLPVSSTGSGDVSNFVPLAPLVVRADGNGIEGGDTELTGDMLLRPNLASDDPTKGAALVNFKPTAVAGAVTSAVSAMLGANLLWLNFGIVANGVTDNASALSAYATWARTNKRPMQLPAGTIKTTASLDISGLTIVGDARGYRNGVGTIIEGAGTHDVLVQSTADVPNGDTSIFLENLRIKGGIWGIKVRYMLHSRWQNVHVTDCTTGGIQFGNTSDAGGLFNTFDNIETEVTGTGIDINGNGFANANSFNQCFFKGTQYAARVRCNGGIGATDNVFTCCEFLGDRYGVELDNTSNTVFNGCYFESKGPSLLQSGTRNIGWALNNSVFAVLENTNPTGRNAFIYHAGTGTSRGSISGGFIYLANLAMHANLSFVASENPATFFLFMADQPELDVTASNFTLLNGLTSANLNINQVGTYTPTWTGSGSNPVLGNGSLVGNFTRAGNQITVTINLTIGSTTTFGSGDWTFGLPVPAQAQTAGAAYIRDAGTGFFDGIALVGSGSSGVAVYRSGGAALVGATVPMTWATGDELTITLTYRC